MIIELTAVPGSGKTYLTRALTEYLKNEEYCENFSIYTSQDLIASNIDFKYSLFKRAYGVWRRLRLIDMNLLTLFGRIVMSKRAISDKKRNIMYVLDIFLRYSMIHKISKRNNNRCIFIMDEGLLHIASVFFNNNSLEQALPEYFNRINNMKKIGYQDYKKIYLFIESDIDENYHRIESRDQGWPKTWTHLSGKEKRIKLQKSQKSFLYLKDYVKEKNLIVIEINNTVFLSDYKESFKHVLNNIANHYELK